MLGRIKDNKFQIVCLKEMGEGAMKGGIMRKMEKAESNNQHTENADEMSGMQIAMHSSSI